MDSMRSLNRSLPTSNTAARPAPPEQLLQAFKQAALSVTNLYKSAATDHEAIRQTGYQDALDDLLKFLDRENLGLQDGEGWRVRQWATARYDGPGNTQQSEDEDDQADVESRHRSASPEKQSEDDDITPQQSQQEQPRSQSMPPQTLIHEEPQPRPVFQFSAGQDSTMSMDEAQPQLQETSSADARPIPVKVDVISRNRNAHRANSRHTTRPVPRTTTPQTAGSKRKLPFPDISDIFNVGFDKKDTPEGGNGNGSGGGGSKRSRFV